MIRKIRVEIGLQVFWAQAVLDAERPSLEVREHAVDPGQHHVGGRGADDPRVVVDPGRAGVGRTKAETGTPYIFLEMNMVSSDLRTIVSEEPTSERVRPSC